MPELMRFHASRAAGPLSPVQASSIGTLSHPQEFQSARFKGWHSLCKLKQFAQIKAEMMMFLQSDESTKVPADLGVSLAEAVQAVMKVGNRLTKDLLKEIVHGQELVAVFEEGERGYEGYRTAIADTALSLAVHQGLGHADNMDYVTTLKVMTFLERVVAHKLELPEMDLLAHFKLPLLLPSCFFRRDLCEPQPRNGTAFSFLAAAGDGTEVDTKSKGCISKDCGCKPNLNCVEPGKCCVKPRIDIIDLMVVKHKTHCYVAGDLSYIRNVFAGEELGTKHRALNRLEQIFSSETEKEEFEERYHQTEDKTSVSKETEEVLKQDRAFEAGMTVNAKIGGKIGVYEVESNTSTTLNASNTQSKAVTNKETRDYSKDVLDRATKRVSLKVKKSATTKSLAETEETNDHSFKNATGNHLNGQYFYVNKVDRAQVFSWGKYAVVPILVPEPATLYKSIIEKDFEGVEPTKPEELDLDAKSITDENFKQLVAQWGLTNVTAPPRPKEQSCIHFEGGRGGETSNFWGTKWYGAGEESNDSFVTVPTGYFADGMDVDFSGVYFNQHSVGAYIELKIGSDQVNRDNNGQGPAHSSTSPFEGTQAIFLYGKNVTSFKLDLCVTFTRKPEYLLQWQTEILVKINAAYEKVLDKYNKELSEFKAAKVAFEQNQREMRAQFYNQNPFILGQIQLRELKRMAITYMSCQYFDRFDAMKAKMAPCGYPDFNIQEAEKQGQYIQFFEQAFEWNLMTYLYYPYFWGRKCTWESKIKETSNDMIFQKFLEAGSCKMDVPIRHGWEGLVMYFFTTGEIWGGNSAPPLFNDPQYLPIVQEIKEQFDNFATERRGRVDATHSALTVEINGTDEYWDYGTVVPYRAAGLHVLNIQADLDREMRVDYIDYRIVDIQENTIVPNHTSWTITIDRPYEGVTKPNQPWATGAVYIGAPWEFVTPTTLTFLREQTNCLPCYPLKDCIEPAPVTLPM